MSTEIKVYLLTKQLFALYGDERKVEEQLINLLGDALFWENWFERYFQIAQSKEAQIMLLREAGFSYRDIQKIARVSPSTIQKTLQQFKMEYEPLKYAETIARELDKLEIRMKTEGMPIW